MHAQCGIWLSHKEAFIIELSNDPPSIRRIESTAERKHKSTGGQRGPKGYAHRSAISTARDDENRKNAWRTHFKTILAALPHDVSVLVMGPGPAKANFAAYVREHAPPDIEIVSVEPADKMSTGQMVAKVKNAFGQPTRVH